MELFQAGHIIYYIGFRRVAKRMIFFCRANDEIYHIGEAAAATATLLHGVIDFGRNDQLPTVFIKEAIDDVPDFFVGDVIATANQHLYQPSNMIFDVFFLIKRMANVKKKAAHIPV